MTWLVVLVAVAAEPAPFDAFFADFAKKRDAVHAIEAHFTQKNVSTEETIESSGTIVYVKPRRVLFRYEKPDEGTTYLLQDRKAYEYEPDIKQLQIYNLDANAKTEIFYLGFTDKTEDLRKAYDVGVFKSEGDASGSHGITIRPKKDGNDEVHFQEVRLFLRDADYLPYRIHIVNDDESQVDIAVSGYVINGTLDPAKAQIALAEETKIIENDEKVETVGPGGKRVPPLDAVQVEQLAAPPGKETPSP